MIIRDLYVSDLPKIDTFWQKHHKGIRGIPERKYLVSEAVVENDDQIVGYGHLRFFAEALMYLNKDASKYQQSKAFKLMMDKAIGDSRKAGLDVIHIGTDDVNFEMTLRSHYKLTDRGTVLALGLDNG
jgi:hypothetical protein